MGWVASLLFLVFGAIPAGAQDASEGVTGTLSYTGADGKVPVAGVDIRILDADGSEVATGTSADDGTIAIDLPGPGTFTAEIVTDTFPEGVTLKDPETTSREITAAEGQSRPVLFPLVEGSGGGPTTGSFGSELAQLVFDGVKFGMIIAMCSIGLSLIFGTTGLTNFAHGELVAFGALFALMLNDPDVAGLHIIIAGFLAVVATALAGAANERFLWRPLRARGTGLIAQLVISIGLSILVRYLFLFQAGGRKERYTQYSLQEGKAFGPITVVNRELVIMGLSLIALIAVATAVQKTRIGKAMRAVSDNKDLAESSGIDVERVILTVWIIGGGLAGLGGVLFGMDQGVSWDMGFELLLLMFAAVTLGGLGTAYGPLLGSLLIGLLVNVSTVKLGGMGLPTELKNVGALLVLVLILLVRPQGLLGRKERIG